MLQEVIEKEVEILTLQIDDVEDVAIKSKESDIGSDLTTDQVKRLLELLKKYDHLFARNPNAPGRATGIVHSIETEIAFPIADGPRRHSPAQREIIRKTINDLLEAKIIRESKSPWASPVLIVPR